MALSILKLINPRCGIPVVIMGETGCGKTCLIRYMCGLQSGPGGPKNMLLMKVRNKQVVSYRVILPICEYVLTVYLISSKITLFADFFLCVMDK